MINCYGCYKKLTDTCVCLYTFYDKNTNEKCNINIDGCVCMTCIVKGVCKEMCNSYYVFWRRQYNTTQTEPNLAGYKTIRALLRRLGEKTL